VTDIFASLEENRLWITLGFGAIASILIIIYAIRNAAKNQKKKDRAKTSKRKLATAGAAGAAVTGVDSNGMPLDDDDNGEYRDGFNDDMNDGEAVYKDWD